MKYKLEDLIDVRLLQSLQEKLNSVYSFPSTIIDNDGKILTAVAWQDICTKFHRVNPESEKECIKSDKYILEHIAEANPAVSYTCPHGLSDNAIPIIIDGKHLGNFFTGQFFLEKPDIEFFRNQAIKYGFDEIEYLEAVNKVPIWTKDKLKTYLEFIKVFIEIIAGIGLNNLKNDEYNRIIKEGEERYRLILQNTSDWIWEVDENGRYIYSSENVERILGYKAEEIIGKISFDFMPAEESERVGNILKNLVETKSAIVNLENWNIHKNGNPVCLLTNAFPVLDNDGRVIGYKGGDTDITLRKQSELKLKQQLRFTISLNEIAEIISSNDNSNDILENTNRIVGETLQADRISIYDVSFGENSITGLCEWLKEDNPNIKSTIGQFVSLDVFINAFTEIKKDKKYIESYSDNVNKNFKGEESETILHKQLNIKSLIWYPFAFNEKGYYLFTINRILESRIWTNEEISFIESVAKQVSLALMKIKLLNERKKAEDALEYNHKMLLKLSNQVPGVIYQYRLYKDGSSCFPFASEGMNEIYEYSPQELKEDATPVFGRLHPEDIQHVSDLIFESARTLNVFYCEFRVVLPEKGLRWRFSHAVPERMDDGSTLWHGIIYDITERKKTEEELIRAKEKAEESDKLKSAFLANMSHEIRTPMNGILGFAQLLKEPKLTGEEQQSFINIIEKSGARMLNIINDIIDISKIESGLSIVKLSESNINQQIEYIYTFFKPEADSKNLILSYNNSLPDAEAVIITDKEKLYAILTNLVKNSIKFSNRGTIKFGYKKNKDHLEFYVKDEGIGIPKDRQEEIFKSFVQADISDKMAFQGSGLGLAITKAYVEMLGGEIRVESDAGQGAAFFFTIPFTFSKENKIVSNVKIGRKKDEQLRKLKILIVEDDEESKFLLELMVKKYSKHTLTASSGADTLKIYRSNPDIDLILMDLKMPNMNGYETTREIRKSDNNIIIIAQTAYALAGDEEKAITAGCNGYLPKPLKQESIDKLLLKYFKNK
ncbi:MAG: PocR ligand-binding domain-containing protein [Candidatus Kapaibacterium sp.]